ncbi:MFS transporter [Streptomyces sp. NPDC050422]|uniref:MFS transporter n=1 Tax=Streptomyces sp. NPDC050422 TaxID=3365614 RepID=UPI00378F388E
MAISDTDGDRPAPPGAPGPARAGGPTRRLRLGYASGALVTGTFTTLPGLLLLPYLTDTLGVGAALAGAIVFVPKAWDAVINPLVGRASDRTRTRWGSRRPYVLGGGLAMALAFALTFSGLLPGSAGAWLTAAGYLLTATAFAFFQVPYAAMPAELVDREADRVRLVAGRVAVIGVAALVTGALSPVLVDAGGGGLVGHRWAGLFGATFIALGALWVFAGTAGTEPGTAGTEPGTAGTEPGTAGTEPGTAGTEPGTAGTEPGTAGTEPGTAGTEPGTAGTEPGTARTAGSTAGTAPGTARTAPGTARTAGSTARTAPGTAGSTARTARTAPGTTHVPADEPTLRAQFAAARANPPFMALLRCVVAQSVATGVLLAGAPYFARHILHDSSGVGALVAAFVAPNLLTMPLWSRLRGPRGYTVATTLFAAGCLLFLASPVLPEGVVLLSMALAGTGHAGQLLFLYAMLPDCIARDTARTGRHRGGVLSGVFTTAEGLGVALGPFLYGLVLQLTGYVSSGTGHAAEQTATARAGILAGFGALPALAAALAVLLLRSYDRPYSPLISGADVDTGMRGHAPEG